ncbi:YkgJ family cysteine cluster protein [Arenicella xantha]|uniref:Putative zinc-or iron-chelating protein n=1 Tax=Arenicella xantha TaxID=644221 RepID=A0A395JIU8_9GAMM|nr:YkgJ family cysteine cluster protein [Arenicella xantha]RBP50642.1 putative zinc- or iron-chelating protein [Arenicella xantha]
MKACNSCGKCCIKYSNGGLSASDQDLELWETLRPEIFRYVRNGNIWMDPLTGEQIELCPWLRREPEQIQFSCAIYFDRPEDCRVYPATVSDMIKDECEMLEPHDLSDLPRATRTLKANFTDY